MEKPLKLEFYDGTGNPDEHVDNIDTVVNYYQGQEAVKCKLFILSLKGATMTWFKGLEDESINSWKELYDEFTYRRRNVKSMAALNTII